MEFISAIFSYIFYIIWNFVMNLLNLVPLGSILSLLQQFNATLILDSVSTIMFGNSYDDNIIMRALVLITMLALIGLAFGISVRGIKYLYGNIADYLFKYKYQGMNDTETSQMLEQNLFEKGEALNKDKITFNYKGFTGIILSRIHAWKENRLKLNTNAEGNDVRFFGVLTFTLIYLFGFMNRKEIKEQKYYSMIFAVIVTVVVGALVFKSSNYYNFRMIVYKDNNIVTKQIPDPYLLDNDNPNDNPKVIVKDTNITISNLSDIIILVFLNALTSDYKNIHINNNGRIGLSSYDVKTNLINEFSNMLYTIKNNPKFHNPYNKEKNNFPDVMNMYVDGKISEDQMKEGLKDINYMTLLFLNFDISKIYLSKTKNVGIGKEINNGFGSIFAGVLGTMYKWKEYKKIYKVVNENSGLIATQKFIYYIGLVPLVKSETVIPLEEAKKKIGIVPPALEQKVQENNNNILLGNDKTAKDNSKKAQKVLGDISKMLSKDKNKLNKTNDNNSIYVANPNYVYKIFGLFPVYPLSTSKSVNVAYYLFLLALAFIQLAFLLLFMGLGRFIYLRLTYTMLDDNQKSNYEIDWKVEITDTLIRIIATLFVYLYLVNTIMLFKII